ncbi:hypothetical protein M8C13_06910 [Crossiella sp. SN42]|uniref:hypothetical protein n=1 Tax=Crossiella sp. SN42 TaxID=2944808 RepID=UPI00207C13D5|nr:hypothetical protein [Crossiella sp. SN42]MCO1575486.1 hypothetical protein [Crossiella sp. SN42]
MFRSGERRAAQAVGVGRARLLEEREGACAVAMSVGIEQDIEVLTVFVDDGVYRS